MRWLLISTLIMVTGMAGARETVLGENIEFGGYGGPAAGAYAFGSEVYFLGGGSGGLLLGTTEHEFTVAGQVMTGSGDQQGQYAFSGLMLGYSYLPERAIHPSVSLAVGNGTYSVDGHIQSSGQYIDAALSAEVNITSFLRTGVSIGRHQSDILLAGQGTAKGWYLGLNLEFGGM